MDKMVIVPSRKLHTDDDDGRDLVLMPLTMTKSIASIADNDFPSLTWMVGNTFQPFDGLMSQMTTKASEARWSNALLMVGLAIAINRLTED